ncbi:hypothetical protein DYI42_22415 [Vannielia litorea]|nr:hypothetical protein [Vannielia litorea]
MVRARDSAGSCRFSRQLMRPAARAAAARRRGAVAGRAVRCPPTAASRNRAASRLRRVSLR